MDLDKSEDFLELVEKARNHKSVIALVLFGSYAKGIQKSNSDIDVCIIAKKDTQKHDLIDLFSLGSRKMDVLLYKNMIDVMKFRVFSEGKVLVLNDEKTFYKIRRKFLHIYRDNYPYMQKQMAKVVAKI